jgi:hypothetical protein
LAGYIEGTTTLLAVAAGGFDGACALINDKKSLASTTNSTSLNLVAMAISVGLYLMPF